MANVKIDKFCGICPRLHPTMLADGMAVRAHNCRLKNGKIVPIKDPLKVADSMISLENGLKRIADAKTIYPWKRRVNGVTELQFLFGSQIHLDIKEHGRILINIGPYYGYRLKTDKEGGFDENDIRHDFGAHGGIGFALVFKNLEAHIEGNYQYSFCSMYHTYKYSDLYWLTAYPQNIYIGVTVYYNLW